MKNFIFTLFGLILFGQSLNSFAQETEATFMVFSDPHYYAPSLGTEGEAFQNYLNNDRKLLKESPELIIEASKIIIKEKPDFVIVPGDLTKDGTLISHSEFAQLMHKIEAERIKVFVVPGNHDISNGKSEAYVGTEHKLVDNVSPKTFENLYEELGFGESIFRDENSLSYVAEPIEGLWLFGLDPCLYEKNQVNSSPITDGEFSKETLEWIEKTALEGKKKGKIMIAAMHQGILEHYKGQNKYFGDYIVNKHKKVSKLFASVGINFVFTGHYHAQDITMKKWKDDSFIYDIETGSLVTYPNPLRIVNMSKKNISISSVFIESIPARPDDFRNYSENYLYTGIARIAKGILVSMFIKREDAQKLSGQISNAFIAHFQGDEVPKEKYLDLKGVGLLGRIIIFFQKGLIKSLYYDLHPHDNNISINLNDYNTN